MRNPLCRLDLWCAVMRQKFSLSPLSTCSPFTRRQHPYRAGWSLKAKEPGSWLFFSGALSACWVCGSGPARLAASLVSTPHLDNRSVDWRMRLKKKNNPGWSSGTIVCVCVCWGGLLVSVRVTTHAMDLIQTVTTAKTLGWVLNSEHFFFSSKLMFHNTAQGSPSFLLLPSSYSASLPPLRW